MSGIQIQLRIDAQQALWAFRRAEDVMRRAVLEGTEHGAQLVAREAMNRVNTKHGALVNSIGVAPLTQGGAMGHEVRPGVAHAPYVELGTGPAAGRPKYYPNPDTLLDYLKTTPSSRRFGWARAGSKKRASQQQELQDRAASWAWHIYNHGTKAHPFMRPAAEASDERVREIMRQAVGRGIAEVFGAG